MDLLASLSSYFTGDAPGGDDASASGGSSSDAGSAFGSYVDGAVNLSDDAAQFAQNIRTVYDAATGTTKQVSGAPVAYQTGQNVSSGVNTPSTFSYIMAWIKMHPILAGFGALAGGLGLFFGIRALVKR